MKTRGRHIQILACMAMLHLQSSLLGDDVFEPENNAPTDLTLSANSIPENEKKGYTVGTLSAIDEDKGDKLTFALVEDAADNALFSISKGRIRTLGSLDFETNPTLTLRVVVTDKAGASLEQDILLAVENINEEPTDILLDSSSIEENKPKDTEVGTLGTVDPDGIDGVFEYSLVKGSGGDDNGLFRISGDKLLLKAVLDFETKNIHSIRVRCTDEGALYVEKTLTVEVINANDPPTGITLNRDTVAENSPPETVVGAFSLVDPDKGNGAQYPLEISSGNGFTGGRYGEAISMSGNLIAVGAYGEGERPKEEMGATYIYQIKDDGSVDELTRIESPDQKKEDKFGRTVSLNENLLIVGAPGADSNNTVDTGAIYVYRVEEVTIGKKTGLPLSDLLNDTENSILPRTMEDILQERYNDGGMKTGGSQTFHQADYLYVLNDSGGTDAYYYQKAPVAVGGTGWRQTGDSFKEQKDLVIFDPDKTTKAFAIHKKETYTIEVYAPNHHYTLDSKTSVGHAENLVLEHLLNPIESPSSEVLTKALYLTRFTDPEVEKKDGFGFAIAQHGNRVAIGAPDSEVDGQGYAGMVYVYNIMEDGSLNRIAKLNAPEVRHSDSFGQYLDMNDEYLVVSANRAKVGDLTAAGMVHLYDFATPGTVSHKQAIHAPDAAKGDSFGNSISLSGDMLAIGSHFADPKDVDRAGAVYLFKIENSRAEHMEKILSPEPGRDDRFGESVSLHDEILLVGAHYEDEKVEGIEKAGAVHIFQIEGKAHANFLESVSAPNPAEEAFFGSHVIQVDGSFLFSSPEASTATYTRDGAVYLFKGIDTDAFQLVDGDGSEDNSSFTIFGDKLQVAGPLDFEIKDEYSIRVLGMDSGMTIEEVFKINVTNANEAPTGAILEPAEVAENEKKGTIVGRITVTDPDKGDKVTLQLAPDSDSLGNEFFTLSGNVLKTATVLDYDSTPEFDVMLIARDSAGLEVETILKVTVTNVNEPPDGLTLTPETIEENLPAGTVVGTLETLDGDAGDSYTYSLVPGDGDTDNAAFKIEADKLQTLETFDYESRRRLNVRIRGSDAEGLFVEKNISMSVVNSNDAPSDIVISPSPLKVMEQQAKGIAVGTLTATDQDTLPVVGPDGNQLPREEVHSFSLTSGEGDSHNSFFQIVENKLQTRNALTAKDTPIASVRVKVADAGGDSIEKVFSITVYDQSDPPTNIELSPAKVKEKLSPGTTVGLITVTDPDDGDTHKLKLIEGALDNDSFFIREDGTLLTSDFLLRSEGSTRKIRILAMDSARLTFQKDLTITIESNEAAGDFFIRVNRAPPAGGFVEGVGFYNEGDTAMLKVSPAANYSFAGFTGDLPDESSASGENPLPIAIDENKTLTAHFARAYHRVSVLVEPPGHGYAWGGGTSLHGETITLVAQELDPKYDCPFSHWSVNGSIMEVNGDPDPLVLKLEADRPLVIKAHFDYGLNAKMKPIPGGKFDMGYIRSPNERPVHTVQVSGFYAHETEITKEEWMEVYQWALQNGYLFDFDPRFPVGRIQAINDPSYKDDFPITGISWLDGVKWCNARSEMEGMKPAYYLDQAKTKVCRQISSLDNIEIEADMIDWRAKSYRLPTEAEWEKASRGGLTDLLYPNGMELDPSFALYDQGRSSDRILQPVGILEPNAYGLYDTIGNAWEMCFDWFWKNWYDQPEASLKDTTGPSLLNFGDVIENNLVRVVRGGSGNADTHQCTVAYRQDFNKTWYQYSIGLRPVVPSPDESTQSLQLKAFPPFLGTAIGSGYYPKGSTTTILASTTDSRGAFVRWEDRDGKVVSTKPSLKVTLDEDMTLTAIFEQSGDSPPFYALETIVMPRDSGTVDGGGAYLQGTIATLEATPSENVDFAGWSGHLTGTQNPGEITMDEHKIVYAYFGDTSVDTDKDGLSDVYEQSIGTLIDESDTDRDSLSDGREINELGSNPLLVDTDEDGFSDKDEVFRGTPPNDPDDFPFMEREGLGLYSTFRGNPTDSSPNKNHGQIENATSKKGRNGNGRNAYYFNGKDSSITFPYKGVEDALPRGFSIWVQSTEQNASAVILNIGKGNSEFSLQLDKDGGGFVEVLAGGTTISGSTPILDGGWHQVIVSLGKGGTPQDISIYVDGQAESLTLKGSSKSELKTKGGSVTLGSRSNNDFFKGYIDDIRFYERSLHASEAIKLYKLEEPLAPPEPPEIRPKITLHPTHQGTSTGATATFSSMATGKPEPNYTWQRQDNRKWQNVKGGTGATLTISNAALSDATNYRVLVTNIAGEVKSRTARLVVLDPPVFTNQPANMLFASGSNASVLLNVTGSKTLRYKWFKDGVEIPKATKNKLTLKKVSPARDNGTYQVEVENGAGKATSDEFNVSVISAVKITANPAGDAFVQGQPATLDVTTTGDGTITYQWEKLDAKSRKWISVEGANSATLTIADMQPENVGDYRCLVDNGASRAYSKPGELGMYVVPTIKTHPRSASVNEGSKVTLQTAANGDPSPTYQWERLNVDGVTWDPIPKATKAELKFSKIKTDNAGSYRVRAINGGGFITSNEANLEVYHEPRITTHPLSVTVNEGDAINLTTTVESLDSKGNTSTYTWYNGKSTVKNGGGVSGAKTANLTIATASAESLGSYYCSIKNGVGSVKSKTAKVTVLLKPYSTKELKSLSLVEGKTATFSASIRGGKPITFNWQKDGVDISGETKNKISRRGVKVSDAGTYSIIASNAAGSLTLSAELTVAAKATDAIAGARVPLDEASRLSAVEDADGDGMSNLLEHALGSDPASNVSTHSPIVDSVEDGSGDTFVSFSYSENKSATGITYIVERSTDLKTWEPVDLSKASVNRIDRGTFTEVTAFIPATDGNGFLRVRIE